MRKCKWCGRPLDEFGSEAFCDYNPNAERNKKMYFAGKGFKRLRAARKKSSRQTFSVVMVPPSPFTPK
jgi:hypothetical protein